MMQSEAPAPEEQAPDQGGGGAASQLITGIQSDMKKLGSVLEKSGAVGPDDLQSYSSLIQGFESFIEKIAGGGEESAAAGPQAQSVSSPEAGSNPNARPM